jgi:hypothetical protein
MPTRGNGPKILIDTSVAVAPVVADHGHHLATIGAIGDGRLGLAGHAAFETFSVLTRLPPPARRPPDAVVRLLADNFPQNRFLSRDRAAVLIEALCKAGIAAARFSMRWSPRRRLNTVSNWPPGTSERSSTVMRWGWTSKCRPTSRSAGFHPARWWPKSGRRGRRKTMLRGCAPEQRSRRKTAPIEFE